MSEYPPHVASFLERYKAKQKRIMIRCEILFVLCLVAYSLGARFTVVKFSLGLTIFILFLMLVLAVKYYLLDHRIKKGYFGGNAYEARIICEEAIEEGRSK